MFKKYNIQVPQNVAKDYITVPNSLHDAFQIGITGVKENIAMYEKLASIDEFPKDILSVFLKLSSASKQQLEDLKRDQPRLAHIFLCLFIYLMIYKLLFLSNLFNKRFKRRVDL